MDLKGTIYWSVYGDAFALMKELLPVQKTDGYWDKAVEATGQLARKYEGTDGESFAREQAMSILNELDRLGKKVKK